MSLFRVVCTGGVREVYEVEAETQEEALARWDEGLLVSSEPEGVAPIDVTEVLA